MENANTRQLTAESLNVGAKADFDVIEKKCGKKYFRKKERNNAK